MNFLLKKVFGFLIIGLFFVGCGGLMAAAPSGQKEKLPLLVIGSDIHDFGEVWSGETIKHAFVVENKGMDNLEIKKVSPC